MNSAVSKPRRQPRAVPAPGRPFQLAERDVWILESLGKMRFLTMSQLSRLFFGGSPWTAKRRLRKLLDTRLVRVWVRTLAQENVYSLDHRGARLLELHLPEQEPSVVPRALDGRLEHLLAINEVRVWLALGLPEVASEIAWWRSDWELRGRFRERLIPDALFSIEWRGAESQVYALEVDNRTRSPRAFLSKILGYVSLGTRGIYGVSDFIALVVGRDAGRLDRYRLALLHAGLSANVWFSTLAEVSAGGVHREIWRAANAEDRCALLSLVACPYGRDRRHPENC